MEIKKREKRPTPTKKPYPPITSVFTVVTDSIFFSIQWVYSAHGVSSFFCITQVLSMELVLVKTIKLKLRLMGISIY